MFAVIVVADDDDDALETTVIGKQRRCRFDDGDVVRDSNGFEELSRSCSNVRFNAIQEAMLIAFVYG
jgi:hypothetical protein